MTVFKAFLKILNRNKGIVIMYTVILLVFGVTNMSTNNSNNLFTASKPSVLIVNEDNGNISKNLVKYFNENSEIKKIANNEEARNDALFYQDVSYIIYIPKNYSSDFLSGKDITLDIKKTDTYNGAYAEMLLNRYLNVANIYQKSISDETELINKINETLKKEVKVEVTSKLNTGELDKASFYYNFMSYSMLACLIYVICLILQVFNQDKISKRNIISSTNYKKSNRILLLSNFLYSFVLWLLYFIVSIFIVPDVIFSMHGVLYLVNSFIFMITCITLSFLLGNLIRNKNAISGVVNVIALGSSFLCGVFVPVDLLPSFVLSVAHIFPTFYYVEGNTLISSLEDFSFINLKPLFMNFIIMIIFSIVFIILTNIASKKRQKIG